MKAKRKSDETKSKSSGRKQPKVLQNGTIGEAHIARCVTR